MSKPTPLKKEDELAILLNDVHPSEIIGEFKRARMIRLLNESKVNTQPDRWVMFKSLIEYYSNNLELANQLSLQNLATSDDLSVLKNLHYIFNNILNIDAATKTVEKIISIANARKIDPNNVMPNDIELEFMLNGILRENIERPEFYKQSGLFRHLLNIQDALKISDDSLKKLSKIVHELVVDKGARLVLSEYSYVDGDFLVVLYINKEFSFIYDLNKTLPKLCIKENLIDDLNKISFYFAPCRVED